MIELGLYTFADVSRDPQTGVALAPDVRMRHLIEEIELADQVGLDVFGVGEHHRPDYSVSAPAVVLARGRGAHDAHPADERGHRPQLGRSRARLPAVRHRGPAVGRTRRDHGGARLVHRVVSALRAGPARLRRAVCGEAGPAAAAARRGAHHMVGRASAVDRGPGRVSATRPGSAADLGRRRRHAGLGGPRRDAGAADGAGDHRRRAGPLRAVCRALSHRRRAGGSRSIAAAAGDQLARAWSPTPRSARPTRSSRTTPRP